MIRRRDLITLLGGAAAAWPLTARAQQPERMRLIGVLLPYHETDTEAQVRLRAFLDGLARLGWIEGRNLRFEIRWAAQGDFNFMRRVFQNGHSVETSLPMS
jgi:putative tryptophan/tyrosine transport system substrate-binding protein